MTALEGSSTGIFKRTLALAAGGSLAAVLLMPEGQGLGWGLWQYISSWAFMTVTVYPFLLFFLVFRGKGPFGTWPSWREFELGSDDLGMPKVRWRERSMFLPPREVSLVMGETGQWLLQFTRPKVVDTGGNLLPWMIFGFFAPVAKGLSRTMRDGGEIIRWPWETLTAIEVVPWRARHGNVGMFTHNRRETSLLLVAHFSDGSSVELSDCRWSQAALAEFNTTISREFITRRPEHLKRFVTAARMARNAEIGERKKVV